MATVGDPFDPHADDQIDLRRHAPATERNRDVILDLIADLSAARQTHVLELASGTGQHAAHIAPRLPHLIWQPSDIEEHHLNSIMAWRDHVTEAGKSSNILDPLYIDLLEANWAHQARLQSAADLVFSANLIHIAPPEVALHMLSGVPQILAPNGLLLIYGPFKRNGEHTSESNAEFEQWLKSKDPRFGVHDMGDIEQQAKAHGLRLVDVRDMPANNFSLIFERHSA